MSATTERLKVGGQVATKIAVTVVALAAVGYGIFSLLSSPTFRIHKIEIVPSQDASLAVNFQPIRNELNARLSSVLGRYTWNVDIEDALARIEKDRRIKDARIRRILPDRLRIVVTPHVPIANVMGTRSDQLFPMARDGELLPPQSLAATGDRPILRGPEFLVQPDLRTQAVALLLALPTNGTLSRPNVSEIQFDKKVGFKMTVSPSGTDVLVGFNDFAEHAEHAQRVLDYLNDQHLTGRIIDARMDKKVVVKLRNAP